MQIQQKFVVRLLNLMLTFMIGWLEKLYDFVQPIRTSNMRFNNLLSNLKEANAKRHSEIRDIL